MTDSPDATGVAPTPPEHAPATAASELPLAGRRALVTLLTHRFVARSHQREAWAGLLAHEDEIRQRLGELFLELEVDHRHEVAFKRQAGGDDAPVLLRREKPLSRDASFLLIFLRREHAFTDAEDDAVVVSRDQMAEFLGRYHDDAHDEVRAARRVDAAVAALLQRDLLEPEPDDPQLFTVAPAIVPLVRPEQLAHFERVYLAAAEAAADGSGGADRPDDDLPPDDSPAGSPADRRDVTGAEPGAGAAPDAARDPHDAEDPQGPAGSGDASLDVPLLDLPTDPEGDRA
ncbi:DUF4194 domain-containing protein [Frigoribacterium salinisoli]